MTRGAAFRPPLRSAMNPFHLGVDGVARENDHMRARPPVAVAWRKLRQAAARNAVFLASARRIFRLVEDASGCRRAAVGLVTTALQARFRDVVEELRFAWAVARADQGFVVVVARESRARLARYVKEGSGGDGGYRIATALVFQFPRGVSKVWVGFDNAAWRTGAWGSPHDEEAVCAALQQQRARGVRACALWRTSALPWK